MGKQRAGWKNVLLNAALVAGGVVVVALLYAFVTGTLLPRVTPDREENPGQLVGDIIQVEVRNGCGVADLAAETTRHLRRHGFDVVEVGDYSSFDQPHSLVIDRVGNMEAARKVAAVLGIPEEHVKQDIRPDYYLDASVIIGKDYATLTPFKDE